MPRGKETMTAAQLANLKAPWTSETRPEPTNKGRKKNRINELLKKIISPTRLKRSESLSLEEINTIEQKVLALELSELQLLAKTDETSAYAKTLAMAIVIDMKNGRTTTVDKLRDRQYGTVKQTVDVTTAGHAISQPHQMTGAEAKKLIEKINKDC